MRILIDQNISFRIIPLLKDNFSEIAHVKFFGMEYNNDHDIFMFARSNNFEAILTLDEDFNHLQLIHGIPPKVIWIRGKNSNTQSLASLINENTDKIISFLFDIEIDCLEIWR